MHAQTAANIVAACGYTTTDVIMLVWETFMSERKKIQIYKNNIFI